MPFEIQLLISFLCSFRMHITSEYIHTIKSKKCIQHLEFRSPLDILFICIKSKFWKHKGLNYACSYVPFALSLSIDFSILYATLDAINFPQRQFTISYFRFLKKIMGISRCSHLQNLFLPLKVKWAPKICPKLIV